VTAGGPDVSAVKRRPIESVLYPLFANSLPICTSGENRLFMMIRIFAPKLPIDLQ